MTASVRLSLKARLMLIIGGITALLMTVISMSILYQWRVMIVENQRNNAEGVTRAIAITLTDAFLYGEAEDPPLEDLLERNVRSFAGTIPGLRWLAVIDNDGLILAHTNDAMAGRQISDSLRNAVMNTDRLISAVSHTDPDGWILETVQPLSVGGQAVGCCACRVRCRDHAQRDPVVVLPADGADLGDDGDDAGRAVSV